ncbi:hypothetical protein A3Q56_00580 [Intoshia linei]|uniref:Uroporphyrinogen-III synthase n=1 Tax=Intoshia linei TaxID=1819745 RepID=A0A177BBI2_9BILA|nr:hypothetical protein A3Q56_00580 [Intoshia linei]
MKKVILFKTHSDSNNIYENTISKDADVLFIEPIHIIQFTFSNELLNLLRENNNLTIILTSKYAAKRLENFGLNDAKFYIVGRQIAKFVQSFAPFSSRIIANSADNLIELFENEERILIYIRGVRSLDIIDKYFQEKGLNINI